MVDMKTTMISSVSASQPRVASLPEILIEERSIRGHEERAAPSWTLCCAAEMSRRCWDREANIEKILQEARERGERKEIVKYYEMMSKR